MKSERLELKTFGEETAERVWRMEAALERLYGGPPGERGEAVDRLFREIHSLKGAAGAMGLKSVATLAHAVEDVLEPLRSGALVLDEELVESVTASFQWMLAYSERLHLARFIDVSREVATLEQSVAQAFARQGKPRP